MAEDVDEKDPAWSPYHYQEDDGTWVAGIEIFNIPDHDKAMHMAEVMTQIMQAFIDTIEQRLSTSTH